MTDQHAKVRLNGHILGSLLFLALAFAGWGAFLYTLRTTTDLRNELTAQVARMDAERTRAVAERDQWREAHERQQGLEHELTTARAALETARTEIAALTQAQEQARTALEAAKQEVATLSEQLEEANSRVQQTGTTRKSSVRRRSRR